MKRDFLALTRSALLQAAITLAFAAAPAFAQTLSAIYVMKLDGSEVRKVSHSDGRWLGSPAWSHDAKRLAYDAAPPNRNYSQCRIRVENLAIEERLAGASEVDDLGYGCGPQWSPDDNQLAFFLGARHAGGERPGVYVMNVDGEGREWICEGQRPRWSPNGEKLLVVSQHEGFGSLYIYDIFEASLTRVLERGYDQVIGGCWSPDGKQIAFVGYKGGKSFNGGRGELALVDAAACKEPQALVQDRVGWQPDWSPGGKRILGWISRGGSERLQLFDPEGLEPSVELLGQAGAHNSDAMFSPDGKRIVWASTR